jgi:hypothetical protein
MTGNPSALGMPTYEVVPECLFRKALLNKKGDNHLMKNMGNQKVQRYHVRNTHFQLKSCLCRGKYELSWCVHDITFVQDLEETLP